jgi:hypothetical protein
MKSHYTFFRYLLIFISTVALSACNSGPSEQAKTQSPKEETLRALVGEHSLSSISAFMGANTMADYTRENGTWKGFESSNSGGQREGGELELTADDIASLQSAKIIVSQDLKVHFSCNDQSYYETPFQAEGMTFQLAGAPSDASDGLSATTTFKEDYLYLYAKDQIDFVHFDYAAFIGVMTDAVVLRYNLQSKTFELAIFQSDCCDNAIFYFAK